MYAIARRSSSNPNIIKFLADPASMGRGTVVLQLFPNKDAANAALKLRTASKGYFVTPLPNITSSNGKVTVTSINARARKTPAAKSVAKQAAKKKVTKRSR